MKVTVKIDHQLFEVEIDDLSARPITAVVDGQRFEVWPEAGLEAAAAPAGNRSAVTRSIIPAMSVPEGDADAVYAPIPGVIVSIAVQPGDVVEVGQELCVLEAMKMKNAIRAPRAGRIEDIHVSVGQHVKHHEPLMDYATDGEAD
ncbi:MAG: acetyl-CoA carboxylase biotin carboxyl carrier protein subunit [Anaerolineae bacterium]|jgi:biotin carboxyl carrier protein|nr:acetyl-CoA carboxylase biotin carboxyl carrier protein subunit [Anaerolineae bacterium]